MEQRPLRLGDIVDDYCPRERRLTNHAIVALVGDGIRQTRCTTCDAEHVYKNGREPRRRKKDDETTEGQLVVPKPPEPVAEVIAEAAEPESVAPMHRATHRLPVDKTPEAPAPPEPKPNNDETPAADDHPADHWPANRTLIRAALPRVDGEPPVPRVIPEFTMHQRQYGRGGRPARFGGGGGGQHGGPERNGNVAGGGNGWSPRGGHGGGPFRGGGSGGGEGQGQGEGGGGRSGRRRGRHKRSRPQ